MTNAVETVAQPSGTDKPEPMLKLRFYSHATLESKDIKKSRQFFEEFLGFDVVQMAEQSFWARMGGDQVVVVVQGPKKRTEPMSFYNHNGLDVATEAEVDAARAIVKREAEKWGLHKISTARVMHGTYSFYFLDGDDNMWEILANPEGGYSWGFARGDQEGKGHMAKDFNRPESTITKQRPEPKKA